MIAGYVLSIAGVVLLTAVVSIVAPSGKMGKFVKSMMKLVVLVVMISPFLRLAGGGKWDFSGEELGWDEGYLAKSAAMMEAGDERNISAYLQAEYGVAARVTCDRRAEDAFSMRSVTICILDFGINGADEHIDIQESIQRALSEKYGCAVQVSCESG